MPATRVTVAVNAKQSQRAPLLIPASASPDPAAATSIRGLVLKAAQSKLKIKKPVHVYVAGTGKELDTELDWKSNVYNDVVLLVSAGEECVGGRKEGGGLHMDANPDCPVYILAEKAPVDELSVTQVNTTAHTLPGMILAVGQPDLHPGTKFPIGAVFVSRKWVHPPLIGGDIGCGMAWYRTKLTRNQVDGDKGKRVAEKLRGLKGAWRTQGAREQWLHDGEGSCSAGAEWDSALGTIGAGNHFAEIQVVESSQDNVGLRQDDVVLLVHSGSRGYGSSILKKYTSESHVSFEEDSKNMKEYMAEHDQACRWAKANRDLIAVRFLSCLEPGEEAWELGRNAQEENGIDILQAKANIEERQVVDIWHNKVERVGWPPVPPPSSTVAPSALHRRHDEADYVYIHRKGAAPTYDADSNGPLALLPLPGSRGTPTMVLRPVFSGATEWGIRNALSLAHGAGRSMSRAKARSALGQKYQHQNILEPKSGEGTWVICDEKDLVFEEAPEAYKDVFAVCDDLVREGVAEVVGVCKAQVSYKVRNEAQ